MFSLSDFIEFIEKAREATPEVLAVLQKFLETAKRHLVSASGLPTTTEELAADLIAGDKIVQSMRDFIVNQKAKKISRAVTTELVESPAPSLAGVVDRLSRM
jgi:hypothetical protein